VRAVESSVRNGVKAVVVSTPDTAARHTYILINEGGGAIRPWAVVGSCPAAAEARRERPVEQPIRGLRVHACGVPVD
jgi:hypothetical protein